MLDIEINRHCSKAQRNEYAEAKHAYKIDDAIVFRVIEAQSLESTLEAMN